MTTTTEPRRSPTRRASDAPPRSVRSARAERTRAAIVGAARELFVTQGYRATSLRDVAAAAGLSHPGLLRHYATKGELLAAVVETIGVESERIVLERVAAEEPGILEHAALARDNAAVPGYIALFAALTGEASTSLHPAHERMRERYADLRDLSTAAIDEAITHGVVADDRDPAGEAVRIAAAWDGLQLLEQYLPGRVSVIDALEASEELVSFPLGWRDPDEPGPREDHGVVPPVPQPGAAAGSEEVAVGYRVGRERRARIIADATALFARDGYGDTSLREIAERVGLSKSTLLHHYASKEELLSAVLSERDRMMQTGGTPADPRAADVLRSLPADAGANAANAPGLIEVYAVLSCEAVPADHPAHDYFAQRFATIVDYVTALFELAQADGDLPSHRDPEHEATWLVALWDGLQYQWLYDRDEVDVAEHLAAHLDDVLPRQGA